MSEQTIPTVRAVVLVPRRSDGGRRDRIWGFVERWISDHYEMPVIEADSAGETFSAAAARNRAAREAGDWEVALFHDSDTIAHPKAVVAAIRTALACDQMVIAADAHMYLDQASSDRILDGDLLFARPDSFDEHGIYAKPCSGVFAVGRGLWEATGGYLPSLRSWGHEDQVFFECCQLFGSGVTWVPGHITYHLWHPPSPRTDDTARNQDIWYTLAGYRRRGDRDGAKTYLRSLGHRI